MCKFSNQGRNRNIFWGGKVIFSGVKCFFPVENFHFGRPKTNFSGFEKWNAKKKKKKKSSLILLLFHLPFSIFHLSFYNFPSFLLNFHPFSLFSLPLFSRYRSAEISRSKVSGGHSAPYPPPPPLLRHCLKPGLHWDEYTCRKGPAPRLLRHCLKQGLHGDE